MERINKKGNVSPAGCILIDACGPDQCQGGEWPCYWDWCIIELG
ncbi:MAG: hypothetical protein PVF58_10130 [Candidatus Methanofastidiosia archaeon]